VLSPAFHSGLYRGTVMHARHDDVARRAFRYGVYVAMLDLDELPRLDRELHLFSSGRRNLFSFDERDFGATLSPSMRAGGTISPSLRASGSLAESLAALREANGLPVPHTTRLVTNLRVAGYTFNPVSFFLDYDQAGAICSVIAEVNNTYGGRFRYVLGAAQRLPGPRVGFRHVRELFVSPFLHGPAIYDFWFDAPLDGDSLAIEMNVTRPGETTRVFTASVSGRRSAMSDRTLASAALRYPFMTAQVIGLIHLQAMKLRLSGAAYRRPGVDHRPLPATNELR
jgi:DUF1365 family protein